MRLADCHDLPGGRQPGLDSDIPSETRARDQLICAFLPTTLLEILLEAQLWAVGVV
jgi:hypothetical protein